ncbi:MAG: hypothetical protein QNJ68_05860 [Microcoleaceae cyanobacterium MO_207.B10]|nr:hypothetical protein [Microcoleaceae cyanobacterium MO_207.B10]
MKQWGEHKIIPPLKLMALLNTGIISADTGIMVSARTTKSSRNYAMPINYLLNI